MCFTSADKWDDREGRDILRGHGVHFNNTPKEHQKVRRVQDEQEQQTLRVLKRVSDKANEREKAAVAHEKKMARAYASARYRNPKHADLYPRIRVPPLRTFKPAIVKQKSSVPGEGKIMLLGVRETESDLGPDWALLNRADRNSRKTWDKNMKAMGRDPITGAPLPARIRDEPQPARSGDKPRSGPVRYA